MSGRVGGHSGGGQKTMLQPIAIIFRYLQSKAVLSIWLYEQKDMRIEGKLVVSSTFQFICGYFFIFYWVA